ncbi:HNH endonuclease, partial [Gordonia sp. DT101]
MGEISSIIACAREVTVADAASGRQVFDATKALLELRNIVDHLLAAHASALDRLGVAPQSGGTTRNLLIEMGAAPGVASRWLRIGTALASLQRLPGYAGDGVFSGEHVDA